MARNQASGGRLDRRSESNPPLQPTQKPFHGLEDDFAAVLVSARSQAHATWLTQSGLSSSASTSRVVVGRSVLAVGAQSDDGVQGWIAFGCGAVAWNI